MSSRSHLSPAEWRREAAIALVMSAITDQKPWIHADTILTIATKQRVEDAHGLAAYMVRFGFLRHIDATFHYERAIPMNALDLRRFNAEEKGGTPYVIPDGYRIEFTDERADVAPIGRRYFRWRAESLRRAHPPLVPSYHLRVEKVEGRWFLYEVVAYQNKLVPINGGEQVGGSKTARAFRPGEEPA